MKSQATNANHHSTTQNTAVNNTILFDTTLPKAAINLYCILVSLSGDNHSVQASIKQLAALLGRCERTVCYHINALIDAGFIERVRCFAPDNTKWNMPSIFVIRDALRNRKEA